MHNFLGLKFRAVITTDLTILQVVDKLVCVEMWISDDCYTGGTKYRTKRRETTKCCGMSDVGCVDKCCELPTAVVEWVWTSRGETTVRRFSRALSSSLAAMARHVESVPSTGRAPTVKGRRSALVCVRGPVLAIPRQDPISILHYFGV